MHSQSYFTEMLLVAINDKVLSLKLEHRTITYASHVVQNKLLWPIRTHTRGLSNIGPMMHYARKWNLSSASGSSDHRSK